MHFVGSFFTCFRCLKCVIHLAGVILLIIEEECGVWEAKRIFPGWDEYKKMAVTLPKASSDFIQILVVAI